MFLSQNGWTALHLAAQEGQVGVVRLLTEAKARVNIQTVVCIYTIAYLYRPYFLSDDRGDIIHTHTCIYMECCVACMHVLIVTMKCINSVLLVVKY